MSKRILIVDDEPSIRKVLSAHLRKFGYEVDTANDGAQAITKLEQAIFHLVVSDLQMPGVTGMDLLNWVESNQPGLPVILITAHGTVDIAVTALKRGAFDFISKPFDRDELQGTITKALATEARNAAKLHEDSKGRHKLIGTSSSMQQLYSLIDKVASSPTTVLITGESGTGKELVARALHEGSDRKHEPFIQINCGAIPDSLFEAELFGYERGAFTGAVQAKPGRFEIAHRGTLFLDEVGELPRDMQVKILRALQERKIDRVGGLKSLDIDVRVIAATNRDLQQDVRDGLFREDLYYRLNVIPFTLPPLRERQEDIPLLVEHFLAKFNDRLAKKTARVSPEVLALLLEYNWPGNIRELENIMERAILLSDSETLGLNEFPGLRGRTNSIISQDELEQLGLKEYVRVHTVRLERDRIQRVLEAEEGNVTRAARRLSISRKSLQTKMKEYGLREG